MSLAALPLLQDAQLRDALGAYLLSVADDELILGHRHSEWTGFAPDIESDVALSSIAQEEIGHARLFYERSCELTGGEPDTVAFGRPLEAFRNAVLVEYPNGDWGFSIVRMFLYDRADAVRLETLSTSTVQPLAELARALRREEKYHLIYGEQWLRRLATATETSRGRTQAALDQAWPEAVAFFESMPAAERLIRAGIIPMDSIVQAARWKSAAIPVLEDVGLRVPPDGNRVGGRSGRHSEDLRILVEEMTSVWRMESGARW